MATIDNNEEMNSLLKMISYNLDNFIENIKCLQEAFEDSEFTLNLQCRNANTKYMKFTELFPKSGDNGFEIPVDRKREFERINKKKIRAEKALKLIPPTYIVSLVSLYDSFYAGLIRCVYALTPDKFQESEKKFCYRELANYDSIKEIKKIIIDSTIDNLLRDSHTEQINWLEKALKIDTLKNFDGWANFIELTERRNLFVHADGVVTSQYISECIKNKYDLKDVACGSKLDVDKTYFDASCNLLYKMAIMLTQILINKSYLPLVNGKSSERDGVFINNVYELISDGCYDIAIYVSDFIMQSQFKHNGMDRGFIILNKAQAHKWAGEKDKCMNLLSQEDTSSWREELNIPKLTLEEQYDEVYDMMLHLGKDSKVLTQSAYREWPIFREIRKEEKFAETFKNIFGVELNINEIVEKEAHNIFISESFTISEKETPNSK